MAESKTTGAEQGLTLDERRAFMKLPVEERRRMMAEQAEKMAEHYGADDESRRREEWQGGDIVEF